MDYFDVEDLEEAAKHILSANPKDLSVTEFMSHFKVVHERDLVPYHYGCESATALILLMSSKFKFMNITGDDSGMFRINLCQKGLYSNYGSQAQGRDFVDLDSELFNEETPLDAALNNVFECQILPSDFKEGTNFPAVVTQIQDPGKFFFNIYSDQHFHKVGDVMNEMDDLYFSEQGNRYRIRSWRDLSPGCALAARYRDMGYHRASLIRVLPHSVLQLSFVDYGSVDRQSLSGCRYLRKKWLEPPGQAIAAHLYGVSPRSGAKYEPEARDEMLRLTSGEPGTLVAVIRSGVSKQEVVVHGTDNLDLYEWQGLAISLVDALQGHRGLDIACELHRQELVGAAAMSELDVNKDVSHIQRQKGSGSSQSSTNSFITDLVSDASDPCEPSDQLKLIRFLDLILCMVSHVVDDKLETSGNDEMVRNLVQGMMDKITPLRNEREEELKEECSQKSNVKSFSKLSRMLKAANKERN